MARKSTKQIGALAHMHRRKVSGFGIIIDRIDKNCTEPLPAGIIHSDLGFGEVQAPGQLQGCNTDFRGGAWHWEAAQSNQNENFILVMWFRKPGEYTDSEWKHGRQKKWYPDSYVKVLSAVEQARKQEDGKE